MDIMQVLHDICKNPEAHDKGTCMTYLILLLQLHCISFWVVIFSCDIPSLSLFLQNTCVSTQCPACSVLPGHLADTATLKSHCCPSCFLGQLLLCCPQVKMVIPHAGGPSTTSAPSCRALCSRCVRETLSDVKAPLCPVCHNRY